MFQSLFEPVGKCSRYAVLGDPIEHSLSPWIHAQFAMQTDCDLTYERIRTRSEQFEETVRYFFSHQGMGLNITAPLKQLAFDMSEHQTGRCLCSQAANTLWLNDGALYADNTDGVGFCRDLSRHLEWTAGSILVIGAGGAARGVIEGLLAFPDASVDITVTNRSLEHLHELQHLFPEISISEAQKLSSRYQIVIHASTACSEFHLPPSVLDNQPFCYDLSYRSQHRPTEFMQWASLADCRVANGLGMLIEQAAESFWIWNKIRPDTTPIHDALKSRLSRSLQKTAETV